jgi:uncharacterized protein
MTATPGFSSDIAFTPTVKALQTKYGSRRAYAAMEANGGWHTEVDDELAHFIAAQDSFFMATANAQGQPYIQHRGGPPGFLRVVDEQTLGFADFRGNRQYISIGNLAENPQVHLFLIDYVRQARIKIWGTAHIIDNDPELLASMMPPGYQARGERVIMIRIAAWDANCPQHIPQRIAAADVAAALAQRDARIAALESALAAATAATATQR